MSSSLALSARNKRKSISTRRFDEPGATSPSAATHTIISNTPKNKGTKKPAFFVSGNMHRSSGAQAVHERCMCGTQMMCGVCVRCTTSAAVALLRTCICVFFSSCPCFLHVARPSKLPISPRVSTLHGTPLSRNRRMLPRIPKCGVRVVQMNIDGLEPWWRRASE